MSPLGRQHHGTAPARPERQTPGRVIAVGIALLLTISACSPDRDTSPASEQSSPPAAAESAPSTTEPDNTAEPDETTQPDETTEREEPSAPEEAENQGSEAAVEMAPPASFDIPAIDAGSELLHLGLRDNGTLDVPPGDPGSPASWYTGSPAPGEQGPAVFLGHVDDSAGDPGVFAALPGLVEGDQITVTDEDGEPVTFVVTKAEQYGKNTFPTLEVYGNTEEPELRLITCDGYNAETGEYEDNYVVYATAAP